jgi:glutamate synthase (NADPH/NADH) large chain
VTDSQGRVVSFKNALIIMTSNLGSAAVLETYGDKQQVQFHADRAAEPIGSLGWDGPLGPLSPVPLPVSDYLQETVAVVTNPAIDREREVEHFSTRVVLGRRPPIEGVEPEPPQRCELRMPIILGGMRPGAQVSLAELRRVAAGQGVAVMEDVQAAWGDRYARLPLYFATDKGTRDHVEFLCTAAVEAVSAGAEILVLEDRHATPQQRVIDPHLAVAAVDKALRDAHDDEGVALIDLPVELGDDDEHADHDEDEVAVHRRLSPSVSSIGRARGAADTCMGID